MRGVLLPLAVLAFGIWHSALTAQPGKPGRSLSLYLLGHRIGTEQYSIENSTLTSHFEYLDRATKITLDTTLAFGKDFAPLSFESHGRSYRVFPVNASVAKASGAPDSFTLDGMAPISAQGLLIRYWLAHDKPRTITLEPSGDTVHVGEYQPMIEVPLRKQYRHFAIDGVTWGAESLWMDPVDDRIVAAVSNAGVLPFEAADESMGEIGPFIRAAVRDRLGEAAQQQARTPPIRRGTFALTGGRLIDATGAPPVDNATVIVRDGRVQAAGAAEATPVPRGVAVVDVKGKTILPGLWDMHAHVGLEEWGPVYLASGVTTARDMGGEFDVVTALRDAWRDGKAIGPRLLLAGLVDGPGPGSFGHVTAANVIEARSVVDRYKQAGFQQMKLYSLLDKPTTQAVIDAAHAAGMTVTGHIPGGLTMREAIEMGMDNVAHLTVRDAPGSDALRDTIAFLKQHRTVIDPTLSWNELLGRSAQTPIASFIPRVEHVAPPLRRMLDNANGGNVTPEQAHDRIARSLQIVKALHDAGIPIVAGTDKGVPGVSLAREIELYVEAGISPIDAIRAATAVPAKVMGLADESGTIRPGLRADLIVVDGNPLERIADIEKIAFVCANGRLYEPAPLWRAGGFRP
jgi:imidazolonepropionase-like amidohydrolase